MYLECRGKTTRELPKIGMVRAVHRARSHRLPDFQHPANPALGHALGEDHLHWALGTPWKIVDTANRGEYLRDWIMGAVCTSVLLRLSLQEAYGLDDIVVLWVQMSHIIAKTCN